jgi:SAM-dependent methyltransferase
VSNFQEQFYNESVNYRTGSPHLQFLNLYDRLVNLLLKEVFQIHAASLPLKVLEIGAGHGGYTEPLLAGGCEVTAIEMSQASVSELNRRFGYNTNFHVLYDDSGSLNRVTDEYSLIACISVLHHIPDYMAAIDEMLKRLEIGGSWIALQDPIWYPSAKKVPLVLNRLGYFIWRLGQGQIRRGLATRVRRMRGILDESNAADMVEYHVIRSGVNQDEIFERLSHRFRQVTIVPYWSNQLGVMQKVGDMIGLENTFGIIADGFKG